jgi:hypothetical protein
MTMKLYPLAIFLAIVLAATIAAAQGGAYPNGQPPVGVQVTFNVSTIAIGSTAQASARFVLADGSLNIMANCLWSSSNTAVATVSSSGVVTGVGAGTSVITCTPAGPNSLFLTGSSSVTVGAPPIITSPSCGSPPCALPAGTQSVSYSVTPAFTASGGVPPYTWTVSSGSLPTGLSLGNSGCLPSGSLGCNITGTPTGTGTTTFTIEVTDSASNSNTLQVSITVNASAGAPLTYAARTDFCETGTESQCTSASTGNVGSKMAFQGRLASLGFSSGAPCPSKATGICYDTTQVGGPDTAPAAGPSGSVLCDGTLTQPSGGQYPCASTSAPPYSLGYLVGGSSPSDVDFNANIYRVTDYSLANGTSYPCGTSGLGTSFNMGSGSEARYWAVDSSKFIINNTSGVNAMFSWNPSTHIATPSAICGKYFPGQYSFSSTSAHIVLSQVGDQESSVVGTLSNGGTYGTFQTWPTPETITQSGGATSTVLAVSSTLMQIGAITSGADNGTAWTGAITGAKFTPTSGSAGLATQYAYVNFIYKGIICDGSGDSTQALCPGTVTTTPSTWVLQWQPVFNFNDVHNLLGAPIGGTYFPTETAGVSNCLPYIANSIGGKNYYGFNANYTGEFLPSYDGTSVTQIFGDNGQGGFPGGTCTNSPGGTCQGPVYIANWTSGSGCRMLNTMTMKIAGDWGPVGQVTQGQYQVIIGTHTGTCNVGDVLTQGTTGAVTQILYVPTFNMDVGYITGTPDASASHHWTTPAGCTVTPNGSALPFQQIFTDYDTIHEAGNSDNALYGWATEVQQTPCTVSSVSGNTPAAGQTTISCSNSNFGTYTAGQQMVFENLVGSASYLNAPSPYYWPSASAAGAYWAILSGSNVGAGTSFVITDTVNPNGAYTASQATATNPSASPFGVCTNGSGTKAVGFFCTMNWKIASLEVDSCLAGSCRGHDAKGYVGDYTAKVYTAHNWANPSLPCAVTPATPCLTKNESPLFNQAIPGGVDQHGTYHNSGTGDLTPAFLVTTDVSGQAPSCASPPCGAGNQPFSWYMAPYWDEIVAGENYTTSSANAHCSYTTVSPSCGPPYGTTNGCVACMYRIAHTFNTAGNWNFAIQNNIGNNSPDGRWLLVPSDMGGTLGCMDGSVNCWSSYVASGPPKATVPTVVAGHSVVTTNASGVVTVNFSNQFCTPGTFTGTTANPIYCGPSTMPYEQATFSGFTETWLNSGTMTITAVSGCSNGTCASFSGTVPGAPLNYTGGFTEPSAAAAKAVVCTGSAAPCARADIFVVDLESAN